MRAKQFDINVYSIYTGSNGTANGTSDELNELNTLPEGM